MHVIKQEEVDVNLHTMNMECKNVKAVKLWNLLFKDVEEDEIEHPLKHLTDWCSKINSKFYNNFFQIKKSIQYHPYLQHISALRQQKSILSQ